MSHSIVYHPDYQTYNFGPAHPFSPVRLVMLVELLEALDALPEVVEPTPATRDDVLTVHSEAYVEQVEAASHGTPRPDAQRFGLDTGDVPTFAGMDAAARALVGGTLHAARLVATGQAHCVLQLGGGLHHAGREQAAGFCVYNDGAVAIRYLRQQGLRVAYLDIDVHHGDGVQGLFYDEPDVLTISLHESGRYLYPGTGFVDELGEAKGKGFKLNVPLEPFTHDASYLEAFEHVVPRALLHFQPDVLVVECGADAHTADPLAHLLLTSHAYETLFRRILELAGTHTEGRVVLTLGGGYDLDATVRVWAMLALLVQERPLPERLPEAWLARWQQRLEQPVTSTLHDPDRAVAIARRAAIEQHNRETCQRLLEKAAPYWRNS
ncbi:MAG: acetoin utilization protein AcuC [Rhodothermales bacterium]